MKGINTWVVPLVRYSGSFLVDEGRTSTNGQENKKTHEDVQSFASQRWYREAIRVKKMEEEDSLVSKKSNCIDILSDKQMKSHPIKFENC